MTPCTIPWEISKHVPKKQQLQCVMKMRRKEDLRLPPYADIHTKLKESILVEVYRKWLWQWFRSEMHLWCAKSFQSWFKDWSLVQTQFLIIIQKPKKITDLSFFKTFLDSLISLTLYINSIITIHVSNICFCKLWVC